MSLRIGVLGAAEISPLAIFRAVAALPGAELVAIGSRRPGAAQAQARQHGLDCACLGYPELLARADIDWVYVPAANSEHHACCEAALRAGKHVLVEKPATLSALELQALIASATARGLCLVEAVMTRHHPWQAWLAERVRARTWGRLLRHSTRLRHGLREGDHFRLRPGGGVLWDDGVYWLQAAQAAAGIALGACAIEQAQADAAEVPTRVRVGLVAADGVATDFDAQFAVPRQAEHAFEFERARVVLADFFRARIGRHKIHLDIAHASGERERVSFDEQNYYLNQLAYLAGDARDADWPAQAQRSVERIAMLEALHRRLQSAALERPAAGA
ncbi:Predicted dehydrogenase [Lysobacter sp. yr284]|uniref:Gfo/Idh/MocA family protein n=1 Tax=Lysobacter sp. yr284 TaxID=1761791 RepID=UPI000898BB44|nr:Gfo/Idh/MocA family oxidoreductase [Lysobacter sp. yr284]SDY57534.1 Predicted dehydrogenase [Lysobacter sp. yr284]